MTTSDRSIDPRYRIHSGWLKLLLQTPNVTVNQVIEQGATLDNPESGNDIRYVFEAHDSIIDQTTPEISVISASYLSPLTFGSFSIALFTAETLLDILKVYDKYFIYLAGQLDFNLQVSEHYVQFTLVDKSDPTYYRTTGSGVAMLMSVILESLRIANHDVSVPCDAYTKKRRVPENAQAYFEQRYHCRVIEGEVRKVIFKRRDLEAKNKNRCVSTYRTNIEAVRKVTSKLCINDIRHQIYVALDGRKTLVDVSIQSIAQELLTTPRTLNRRLVELDTTFKDLLKLYRKQKAMQLLSDPGINHTEIAYQLGFSELSSFTRAFKSWTDSTPSQFRKQAIT